MSKSISHPFGRENEVALNQLLISFCNHLYLGQWECARACIQELHEQKELASEEILDIIEDCINNPSNKSIGPADDEKFNPHHLSWLCTRELEHYLTPLNKVKVSDWSQRVEFRLLLCELPAHVKTNVIKELYAYYATDTDEEFDSLIPLTHQCIQGLQEALLYQPIKTHILLSQLIAAHSSEPHRIGFYTVYIKCLQRVAESLLLKKVKKLPVLQESDPLFGIELKKDTADFATILIDILCVFDPPRQYLEQLQGQVESLLYSLVELIQIKATPVISIEKLYCALLGRENSHLLELFHSIQSQWHRQASLLKCHISPCVEFTKTDCHVLGLAHLPDREEAWKQLLFESLKKQKHFLDIVIELSVKLIEKSEFAELGRLMHVPEFTPLCPLILLVGWDHCHSTEQVIELVKAVYTKNVEDMLHDVCDRLVTKAGLLDRFVKQFRALLPSEELNAHCMKQMLLSGLQLESSLYMIHKYTKINKLPQDGLTQLIQSLNSSADNSTSIEQIQQSSSDIPIYLGFCAIQDFIACLTLSADMRHWVTPTTHCDIPSSGKDTYTNITAHNDPTLPFRSSSIAPSTSTTDIEDIQLRYTDNVLSHLERVKQTLEKLYPLNYRAEILENLFSLLFLRSDDVHNVSENESGAEEGGKEWDYTSSTGPNTPKMGTPLNPSTPLQFTPAKLEEFQSSSSVSVQDVSVDLLSRFMDGIQHESTGSTDVSVIPHSSQSNETDNTEIAMVITQESLKDTESTGYESKSKQVLSAGSNTSSFNMNKVGFIANEYFIRDGLIILKQCLQKLTSELLDTQLSGKQDPSIYKCLDCSISMSEVKSHVVRLTQFVSEGLWRFQLVSHQFIPFDYGKILGDVSKLEHEYNSEDEEIKLSGDEDDSSLSNGKQRRKKQSDSQSGTGTDSLVTTDGSQSARSSSSRKHRRSRAHRRLHRRSGRKAYMKGVLEGKQGIVSRMLSDRNTLLTMCLRRGKVSQASEVVKLFGLEDTAEEAEVLFAVSFQSAVRNVLSHDAKVTHVSSTDVPGKKSTLSSLASSHGGKSVLSNIASIAAKGMASLSVTNTAEHLLGLTIQPSVLPNQTDPLMLKPPISQLVSEELVSTMIVLDLACSGSTAWDSANVLLDLALKRLPSNMKPGIVVNKEKEGLYHASSREGSAYDSSGSVVKGITGLVQTFSSLVIFCSNKPATEGTVGLSPQGINTCLNTAVVPIDNESYKTFLNGSKEIHDALNKARIAVEDAKTGVLLVGNKRPVIRIAFKHLAALFEKASLNSGLMRYICREQTEGATNATYNYLQCTYDYFKTLGCLVAEHQGKTRDEVVQLEYFSLISESPTKSLGKIIFHFKADPYKLQKITDSLNIELMQIVLHNACPSVTYTPLLLHTTVNNVISEGQVPLNVPTESVLLTKCNRPYQLVKSVLCNIIKSLQDHISRKHHKCILHINDLCDFAKTLQCRKLLSDTQRLTTVDLTQLDSNEEKISFFLNLGHLMFIHGALHFAHTSKDDIASLLGQTSEVEKVFAEKRIVYKVGELDNISWYDLQYSILGLKHETKTDKYPNTYLNTYLDSVSEVDRLDPWTKYGPSHDYRLQHALVDGYSQYYLQVYYPEILKHQLKLAELDSKNCTRIKSTGILLSRDVWKQLINQPAVLREDRGYRSLEHNDRIDRQGTLSKHIINNAEFTATYKLSSSVDNYLKYKSNLVATLAGLVAKPHTEQGLTVDSSGEPSTSSRDSHQYKQLQSDFPMLHRHLQTLAMHLVSGIDNKIKSVPDQLWSLLTEDLGYHFKAMLLGSTQTKQFQAMLKNVFIDLLQQRKWKQLADLIIDSPAVKALQTSDWSALKDLTITACVSGFVLQSSMNKKLICSNLIDSEIECRSNVWKLICNVANIQLRVRLLLCSLVLYSAGMAVKYLHSSLHWMTRSDLLRVAVTNKIKEMKMYQMISDCAKRELDRLPHHSSQKNPTNVQYYHNSALDLMDSTDPVYTAEFLQKLLSWQQIRDTSQKCSDLVLEFLLTCNQHDIARQWVEVFHYFDFTALIEESCIFYHLEQTSPNITLVMEILERMKETSSSDCKMICQNLVPRLSHKKCSLMLLKFLKKHLQNEMGNDELVKLYLLHMGCSCFLCLPTNMHSDYDHLIATPVLMLEQLLMNMKIDLSGKVLDCIKMELKHIERCTLPTVMNTESTADKSDKFLSMNMANSKHVDFKIVEDSEEECQSDDESYNKGNSRLKHALLFQQSRSISSTTSIETISPDVMNGMNIDLSKCDKLLVEYAKHALEFSVVVQDMDSGRTSVVSQLSSLTVTSSHVRRLSTGPSSVGSAQPGLKKMSRVDSYGQLSKMGNLLRSTASSVPANLDKRGLSNLSSGRNTPDTEIRRVFVMPAEPPPREKWVPDSAAMVCMACGVERFSMFNRRHHCRRCGRVVCSTCSSKTLLVQGSSSRVCDQCYEQSHKPKQILSNKDKVEKLRQKMMAPVPTSVESGGSVGGLQMFIGNEYPEQEMTSQPLSAEYQYVLTANDEEINDLKREEFYYDHAPSTSLCLSILDLHSDPVQCSQVILDLCDSVSMYLQSLAPGVKNPEVDYGLVISMLKYLLFNAKVKCQKCQDSSGVTKCDLYLDRVNLVDILLANNTSYIPSIQQLTRIDVLRRLRDKLIEEEQWDVANTVSTKCGIDPIGVWVAWGKACLRVGEYKQAREKFAKCLKVPSERNQALSSSKILTDVIECLEVSAVSATAESLLSQLRSVKDLLAEPARQKSSEQYSNEVYFEECVYYLKTYGTYGQLVNFYQKHGQYAKALNIILAERCSTEVMIESLLVPILHDGTLNQLQDAMLAVDPGLTRWDTYITAICRYLNKNRMINVLYHIQLFTKDYIRAAMTCVSYFYQKDAKNYLDLHGRLLHLQDAKSHLESYIEHKMWLGSVEITSSKHGGRQETSTSRLIMTPREVNKYIHTIDLQMETTKYLSHYIDNLKIVLMFTGEIPVPVPPQSPSRGVTVRQRSSPDLFIKPGDLPTLFGSTKMKSEVVALVLLSGNNINDGFGLAFRIIQDMKLDSTSIYAQVGTTLTRQHKYSFIKQLLGCMKDSGLCTDHNFDDVILPCIDVMILDADQLQEAEPFIKLLRSDINKINAYMRCGKLKSAYLMAVKTQRVEVVQRIEKDAIKLNQPAVRSICKKWLQQHGYASLQ